MRCNHTTHPPTHTHTRTLVSVQGLAYCNIKFHHENSRKNYAWASCVESCGAPSCDHWLRPGALTSGTFTFLSMTISMTATSKTGLRPFAVRKTKPKNSSRFLFLVDSVWHTHTHTRTSLYDHKVLRAHTCEHWMLRFWFVCMHIWCYVRRSSGAIPSTFDVKLDDLRHHLHACSMLCSTIFYSICIRIWCYIVRFL